MAVNFKFRSSVDFGSVDIDGPSISVSDLRAKIVEQKNLKVCRDFDLVISDAQTGEVLEDENYRIPAGANVIIKRVPAARANRNDDLLLSDTANGRPALRCETLASTPRSSPSSNVDMDNFDDFGTDLYTAPETSCLGTGFDEDKLKCIYNEETDNTAHRIFPEPFLRCQDLKAEKDHILKDCAVEKESVVQANLGLVPKDAKLDKCIRAADQCYSLLPNADLPSELKCSLCKSIFMQAVMIPCCQHSFCEKCILLELVEKARCPQCLSSRCKIDDLLPNLSLRQAIEHFLESQILIGGLDNGPHKCPPDGESGIHVKESSCAVSIHKVDRQLEDSPSATGRGSNQVCAESVCESLVRAKDGSVNIACSSRNRKGDRRCYTCGSPDHLVKDCPMASGPIPLTQSGDPVFPGGMPAYAQPYYWRGTSLPHVRPITSIYGTPGAMLFDANMVPVSPFGVPPYVPHMYAGPPLPCGFMTMGSLPSPLMAGAERPLTRKEFMELQGVEKRHKIKNEQLDRESFDNDHMVNESHLKRQRRSADFRNVDRDSARSYSGGSEHRRSKKRQKSDRHSGSIACETSDFLSDDDVMHSQPRRNHQHTASLRENLSDKSYSEIQDRSESSEFHSKGNGRLRHKYRSSKKHSGRSEHSERNSRSPPVNSGKSQHRSRNEPKHELERHSRKHHNHLKADRHHNLSVDRGTRQHLRHLASTSSSERGTIQQSRQDNPDERDVHSRRHSKNKLKTVDDETEYDRWEMANGSDIDDEGGYHHKEHKKARRSVGSI
ncbi:E3 ubiquitin-protein ligase [Nymphaea thermarum]|nr:E3 ubiquitin-protein ligase [Nymphaea thermarum]